MPYPAGMPSPVDKKIGKVYASVMKFDGPYVALATRVLAIATATPAASAVSTFINTSGSAEETEAGPSIWHYGLIGGLGAALIFTAGFMAMNHKVFRRRKDLDDAVCAITEHEAQQLFLQNSIVSPDATDREQVKDSGDDARAQELDHNADQADLKADLILVRLDKIEVVEQSALEMAKPAAKLRLKNVRRASGIAAAIAERTAAKQSKSEKAAEEVAL